MSNSAKVSGSWSLGFETSKRTQFQSLGGSAFIATGSTGPTKNMAGNKIPDGRAVEVDAGETVYWRTDETADVFVSWIETGA